MNITFVLPGAGVRPIGGFKVVYEYANHLVSRGHSVTIVHPAILETDTHWSDMPKKCVRYVQRALDKSYMPSKWFHIDERVKMQWVLSLMEKNIPDSDFIIATAWQTAESVISYKKPKWKKFYLIQEYEYFMTSEPKLQKRIEDSYNGGLYNIAISPAVKEMVLSCGAEVNAYIPNGIDFDTFNLTREIGCAERCAIGFPSRPEKFKGTRDAVAALDIVRKKLGDNITAWSFGGRKPDYLPSWISYYERPSDEILCDLYNSSAIFVTASHYEGWGLPGSEAMACGAALVSTEHGGVRAYAEHGRTALLSAPKDVAALAENICRLYDNWELRQNIAQAGYQHIQNFTWDKAVDALEAALSHGGK